MDRNQFSAFIAATLAEHPDWMPSALQGITEGSARALQEAHRLAASKDQAMMAALALLSNHRLGPDLLATLRDRIAQSINPNNASEIEKKFITENVA